MSVKMNAGGGEARIGCFSTRRRGWFMALWCLGVTAMCLLTGGWLLSMADSEPMEEDVPMFVAYYAPDEVPVPPRKPASWASMVILTVPPPFIEPMPDSEWEERISRVGDRADWRPLPGDSSGNPSGFVGTLYDFKEFSSGGKTGMKADDCRALIARFVEYEWDAKVFAEYASHSVYVGAGLFFCPIMKVEEAVPFRDEIQEKVGPHRWAAVYRGRVKAPKTGRLRFVGGGDEMLAVRFDGKLVLDHGRTKALSRNQERGVDARDCFFYESAGSVWNAELGGLRAGMPFDVVKDRWYSMDVLVASLDSSTFGVALLVDDGESAGQKVDDDGVPVFPLFRTLFLLPPDRDAARMKDGSFGRYSVPYDADSPVWSNDGMHFGEESPAGM